jgi:hypothetical protein
VKFLGIKVPCKLGCSYTEGTGLYCDYFIWCVSCAVVVLFCTLCVCVCVCVCVGFVMFGFCNVWVCVCVGGWFVMCGSCNMCGCVCAWVL